MKKFLPALLLVTFSHLSFAENLGEALLKKSEGFYTRFEQKEINSLDVLEKDDLSKLPAKDYEFLKSRIKIYGLAPAKITKTQLAVSIDKDSPPFVVDYQNIDLSYLTIQGINYPINFQHDLKTMYEVDFKKALKQYKTQTASLWQLPLFIFSLAGCKQSSGSAVESATNTNSIPIAYLKLCTECAGIAINPVGATIGGGLTAAAVGVNAGFLDKSLKSCAVEFCKNLPGIHGFIGVYNAHKQNKATPVEHSK
ncbi:MAG: hypothetical protein R3A80_11785 [Bdellovibrionota bacterium]